jgi:hypothetical protein
VSSLPLPTADSLETFRYRYAILDASNLLLDLECAVVCFETGLRSLPLGVPITEKGLTLLDQWVGPPEAGLPLPALQSTRCFHRIACQMALSDLPLPSKKGSFFFSVQSGYMKPSESLCVVGSDFLGEWDSARATPLRHTPDKEGYFQRFQGCAEGNRQKQVLEYKYILKRVPKNGEPSEIVWENGDNRRVNLALVPNGSTTVICDNFLRVRTILVYVGGLLQDLDRERREVGPICRNQC